MPPDYWKKYFIPGLTAAACLLTLSPASLSLWQLTSGRLQPAAWQAADAAAEYQPPRASTFILQDGKITITSPAGRWQNPPGWTIQQAEWTDLNHDGKPEVTLLVRRPFEPWPVDKVLPIGGRIQNHQDADGQSSHIILIGWKRDHWGELWAGSALARPVRSFMAADLDLDGKQELLVREGAYQDVNPVSAATLAVWQWNGFGFDLVTRLEKPSTRFNLIIPQDRQPLILLQ